MSGFNSKIPNVQVIDLPIIEDDRGSLSYGQYNDHIPFVPKRYFTIMDVPPNTLRGAHAHKQTHQFLVCLRGNCHITLDDGKKKDELDLNQANLGLNIPPMIWVTLSHFSSNAVLLVLASDVFSEEDYLRDYKQFLREACLSK
jgi:UDP-2-acetamido-3-amino-2,3-dideoxy-glucuronate N-acetyltransferase